MSFLMNINSTLIKLNVVGKFCDQCRNRFWDLSEDNAEGCQECSCWNDGLLNEIKDCSSETGQLRFTNY